MDNIKTTVPLACPNCGGTQFAYREEDLKAHPSGGAPVRCVACGLDFETPQMDEVAETIKQQIADALRQGLKDR